MAGSRGDSWLSCRKVEWVRRLGASLPMRMTASWFGSWTHRIQGCGAIDPRPKAGSPLIVVATARSVPSCSNLSRYGLARAKHVERLLQRPTLTAPARDGLALLRVGTKKRAFRSNKETDEGQKHALHCRTLDKRSPIQGSTLGFDITYPGTERSPRTQAAGVMLTSYPRSLMRLASLVTMRALLRLTRKSAPRSWWNVPFFSMW